MARRSWIGALGDPSVVHLLEFEIGKEALGGAKAEDPFDSGCLREAGNLIKRVCTKQAISGDYAVSSLRDGAVVHVQVGFLLLADRDALADRVGALSGEAGAWASRRHFLLDAEKAEILNAAGVPRDNRGAGRKAREKARAIEQELGPRWIIH